MFFSVSLLCLCTVTCAVNDMSPRHHRMVRRLFVISGPVMFGRLPVVVGSLCKMSLSFLVVLCSFLRHELFLHGVKCPARVVRET